MMPSSYCSLNERLMLSLSMCTLSVTLVLTACYTQQYI